MRLIDADALRDEWLENGENEYVYDTNSMLDSIDRQPTIDAEPRRFGIWERKDERQVMFGVEWRCSECGSEIKTDGIYKPFGLGWRHCYNCGAKMDGGANE